MNERIKELIEQAGFQYIKEEGIGWAGDHNASLPKFAELIVRECSAIVQDCVDRRVPASQYPDVLKQSFGVEDEQSE